ncbi:uncharacterized protein LOC134836635 isoform X2 [Culicoides brevitarsis]|uniref:uncharacterized protein LOC134836635 isoform X2 n=1 Tax=Culicoides brevitarsis TaxID=469753 RepID=UPI00307B29E0
MSLEERENSADVDAVEALIAENVEIIDASQDEITKVASNNNNEDTVDDESAEKKEMTVTNLKVTFEHLSQISPDAKEKPNWWIRQNEKGEYILYKSKEKPCGSKLYHKLSDPKEFLAKAQAQQVRVVSSDGIEVPSDKITNELCGDDKETDTTSDAHEISTAESSSSTEDDRSLDDTKEIPPSDESPEITVTEVDDAQEVDELYEADSRPTINKNEILSIIKRSSSQSTSNVEALTEKNQRQLSNVVQELIQTEKSYVEGLERGISIYVTPLDRYARNYPALLGKKYHIFGNIERLYAFHKEELLPALLACNDDVIAIATLFYTYITKDFFYGYVLFGLNKPRAEKLTHEYKEFFDGITKESEDKLGVNSFLLKPIQLLPRYKLLFGEIIKALANDLDGIKNVKDIISVCCIAEKQIQRLLDNVNEALSLNDIEEVHEFDLLEQGKFKKMNEFTVIDFDANNRFRGKTFLFEQTILCTELIEKTSKLQYRTHVVLDDVMFIDTDNKGGFKIVTASNREIDFISNGKYPMLVIQEWIKLLTSMTAGDDILRSIKVRNCNTLSRNNSIFSAISSSEISHKSFRRSKLTSNTVRITKREKSLSDHPPRVESLISSNRSSSNRSSSSSQDSYDLGGTIWDHRKYLETLRNIEKHYILLLMIHKQGYVGNIPSYIMVNVREFMSVFNAILEYHTRNIYPVLQINGMDIVVVCNLFKKCLQDPIFNHQYQKYAILGPTAYDTLNSYYINAGTKPGTHIDLIDQLLLQDMKKFIELPFQQLRKYTKLFQSLMKVMVETLEDHTEHIPVEVTRIVANTFVELEHFEKLVTDNYKIHSKSSFSINVKELGLILYSDTVVMEYDDPNVPRHKIFLMESAILAVRVKNDANDTSNEIFDAFIWSLPYDLVMFRHSVKVPERIKVFSKTSKYQQYSIIFRSNDKKRQFLDKLEEILEEKHTNFTSFIEN